MSRRDALYWAHRRRVMGPEHVCGDAIAPGPPELEGGVEVVEDGAGADKGARVAPAVTLPTRNLVAKGENIA